MPNNTENVTTKFKVDISDLKKNITEANRQIKLANAEFKNATAGMDKWSDSADGLSAKIAQQSKIVEAEKTKLDALKQQLDRLNKSQENGEKIISDLTAKYDAAAKEYGENSDEAKKYAKQLVDAQAAQERNAKAADDLRLKIINQDTAVKNASAQVNKYESALNDLENELRDGENAAEADANAMKTLGDNTDKAANDAKNAGDGGFTVFKGVLANLTTQVISKAADALVDLAKGFVNVGKSAVESYGKYEQLTGGVEKLFANSSDIVLQYANDAYKTAGMNANDYMETVTGFSASLSSSLKGDTEKAAQYANTALIDMSDNANTFGTSIEDIERAYQGFAKGNFAMLDNLKLGYGGTKTEMLRLVKDAGVVDESVKSIDDVSFDQIIESIHIIQTEMQISGTTAKEAGKTIEGSFTAVKSSWENLITALGDSDADFTQLTNNFLDAINAYSDNLIPVIVNVADGISIVIEKVLPNVIDKISKLIEKLLPKLLKSVVKFGTAISKTVKKGLPKLIKIITDNLPELLRVVSGLAIDIANALMSSLPDLTKSVLQIVTDLINIITEQFPVIINGIVAIIPELIAALTDPKTMSELLNGAVTLLMAIVDAIPVIINALLPQIPVIVDNVCKILIDNTPVLLAASVELFMALVQAIPAVIMELIPALGGILQTIYNNFLAPVKNKFVALWEDIKTIFTPAAKWFKQKFTAAYSAIKTAFSNIGAFFKARWNDVKSAFSNVKTWFEDKFTSAWTAIKGVFENVGEFFGGIWDIIKEKFTTVGTDVGDAIGGAFKTAINAVIETVENALNAIPSAINDMIDEINKLPGVEIDTIPTVSLPRLAKGGIVDRATLAEIGESGAEAIIPLERNKAGLKKIAALIADEIGTGALGAGSIKGGNVYNFTQTNNSPKSLSRYEIYRQTKNLINAAKLGVV